MTWSLENSKLDEAAKIRWELVPYMAGRALDLGCGAFKVFPHFIGVDSGKPLLSLRLHVGDGFSGRGLNS